MLRLRSPDLFDGRMTDAPTPTYWLDGIADRCISGTALILFFARLTCFRSCPQHPHLLYPRLFLLSSFVDICLAELLEVFVNPLPRMHKTAFPQSGTSALHVLVVIACVTRQPLVKEVYDKQPLLNGTLSHN